MTKRHPYIGLPDRQFWKLEPGITDPRAFDPVSGVPFVIARGDKVVTAGSCFAQHVARKLTESGFNHFITEAAHPIIPDALARQFNYGMFAARYGNVYTARQLLQLLHLAYGEFKPVAVAWPVSGTDGTNPGGRRRSVPPADPARRLRLGGRTGGGPGATFRRDPPRGRRNGRAGLYPRPDRGLGRQP